LFQALDAILREGGYAVLTNTVDAQTAVFREHVDLEFPDPFFILAELFGDVADGEYV
jgi:hypothetical protein